MNINDKKEITKRFIGILKNLDIVPENDRSGRKLSLLSERLFGSSSKRLINEIFALKRQITYIQARTFCLHYKVNEAYLIEGKGHVFQNSNYFSAIGGEVLGGPKQSHIRWTSQKAFASEHQIGSDFTEMEEYISIPNLHDKNLRAINIFGNSMLPIASSGDLVVFKTLETKISGDGTISLLEDIKRHKMYIIRKSGKIWLKFIRLVDEVKLELISENKEHPSFEIDFDESVELFEVVFCGKYYN